MTTMTICKNKKAPTHNEKGLQNGCALLIFPKLMLLELELAPVIENQSSIGCRGVSGPVPQPLDMSPLHQRMRIP